MKESYKILFHFGVLSFGLQGLENSWKKHRKVHEALWKMGDKMGLKWFISDKVENIGLLFLCLIMSQTVRLPTVSLIEIPPHVKDWK